MVLHEGDTGDGVKDLKTNEMEIIDLLPDNAMAIHQAAVILMDSFKEYSDAWPDIESAKREVWLSFTEGRRTSWLNGNLHERRPTNNGESIIRRILKT